MKTIRIFLTLGFTTLCCSSFADEVYMKNGSKLVGTLKQAEGESVVFNTPFAGDITINQANIERIITENLVTIMMKDGAIYHDRRIDVSEEHLVATAENQPPVGFATADIEMINPEPWKMGEGYEWTGNTSAALESERGNSDSDEWDIDARLVLRSLINRYTFDGEMEIEENGGEKTSDDWKMLWKYDRFNQPRSPNYRGVNARFEYDKFADLDLRTTLGVHIGRQFMRRDILTLQGELGPVWVDEQFNVAEDNDFPGALWALEATSDVLGFGTTLYVNHDGILNFDDAADLILNTTIGIRFPLVLGFETRFEAKYEYDGGAVEDVDNLDETYKFRIGYAW